MLEEDGAQGLIELVERLPRDERFSVERHGADGERALSQLDHLARCGADVDELDRDDDLLAGGIGWLGGGQDQTSAQLTRASDAGQARRAGVAARAAVVGAGAQAHALATAARGPGRA